MKKLYTSILSAAALLLGFSASSQVTTFSYTGAVQLYTVPAGISMIQVECWGASGPDNGSSSGGLGGYVTGEIMVTPGEVLEIYVGGTSGFNGGGAAGTGGGVGMNGVNGGGASDVRVAPYALADRFIVAGAGGGAGRGSCNNQNGGDGGYPGGTGGIGSNIYLANDGTATDGGSAVIGGCSGDCACSPSGGGGGGQNGGGGGGGGYSALTPGAGGTAGGCGDQGGISGSNVGGFGGCFGTGGDGGSSGNGGGAGGGGGWFGGGAGGSNWATGGGGGSSYYDASMTAVSFTNGINSGDGQVIITELCNGLTTTVSADTLCYGDSLTIEGVSSIGGTITWDNGATNGVAFFPDTIGLVTYTSSSDTNDCPAIVDVLIMEGPAFTLSSSDEILGGDGSAFVTITGGTFPFTFDWDVDGTGDFDDDQNQSGLSAGTYVVTVMNGNGCTWTDSVVVNTQLGVDPNNFSHQFVYPSPTKDVVNIDLEGDFDYTVTDALGRVIMTGEAVNHAEFSLVNEENGVYLVTVRSNGDSRLVKVVKK